MKKTYLLILSISFLSYFITLIFHFKIIFIPALILTLGIIIRSLFQKRYIYIFTLLIPLIPISAVFENSGMPLNYLMLPLLLLMGIFITDIFIFRDKEVISFKKTDIHYIAFLLIVFSSFIFIMLRWSNLTSGLDYFMIDTPVSTSNIRFSFGCIFPLMYLFLFSSSYLYYFYINKTKDKKGILIYFLIGNSISILFALLQNFFNIALFGDHIKSNGFTSDASAFGFITSISLLFSVCLLHRFNKRIGYLFMLISISGILISETRIGLFSLLVSVIYLFFTLNRKKKVIFSIGLVLLIIISFFLYNATDINNSLIFVKEIENTFHNSIKLFSDQSNTYLLLNRIGAGRITLLNYCIKIIELYPLSGVGTGNFIFFGIYDNYEKDYLPELPGSQYLFLSSSVGLIGLLIFLTFIWSILKIKRGLEFIILITVLIIFLFGSYLWIPECFLCFWILLSEKKDINRNINPNKSLVKKGYSLIFIVFILSNIYNFKELHPREWNMNKNCDYDYGFWYREKNNSGQEFKWTKNNSGKNIVLDKDGISGKIRISCGAPLDKLKDKQQTVLVYWKEKLYKTIIFKVNKEVAFRIKGDKKDQGFIKINTIPTFNLKKIGISSETRDLGVKFFYNKN